MRQKSFLLIRRESEGGMDYLIKEVFSGNNMWTEARATWMMSVCLGIKDQAEQQVISPLREPSEVRLQGGLFIFPNYARAENTARMPIASSMPN